MANNNLSSIFIKACCASWIEPKNIQHQNLLMNKHFQKWSNSIPIEPLEHTHDKSKLHFHGNKLWKENRTKNQMNINLYFQISCSILNQITWDKVHWIQHTRIYTKHGIDLRNKRFENQPLLKSRWRFRCCLVFNACNSCPLRSQMKNVWRTLAWNTPI